MYSTFKLSSAAVLVLCATSSTLAFPLPRFSWGHVASSAIGTTGGVVAGNLITDAIRHGVGPTCSNSILVCVNGVTTVTQCAAMKSGNAFTAGPCQVNTGSTSATAPPAIAQPASPAVVAPAAPAVVVPAAPAVVAPAAPAVVVPAAPAVVAPAAPAVVAPAVPAIAPAVVQAISPQTPPGQIPPAVGGHYVFVPDVDHQQVPVQQQAQGKDAPTTSPDAGSLALVNKVQSLPGNI
jgi:hypothetical protein